MNPLLPPDEVKTARDWNIRLTQLCSLQFFKCMGRQEAGWYKHCLNIPIDKRPTNFIDALNCCDSTLYQTIHRFMQIGATLPISVALSERSFSCLRRLKTYLRSKTSEERLNGLMLLNIYRNIDVKHEEVILMMAQVPRRMDIIL